MRFKRGFICCFPPYLCLIFLCKLMCNSTEMTPNSLSVLNIVPVNNNKKREKTQEGVDVISLAQVCWPISSASQCWCYLCPPGGVLWSASTRPMVLFLTQAGVGSDRKVLMVWLHHSETRCVFSDQCAVTPDATGNVLSVMLLGGVLRETTHRWAFLFSHCFTSAFPLSVLFIFFFLAPINHLIWRFCYLSPSGSEIQQLTKLQCEDQRDFNFIIIISFHRFLSLL